MARPLFRRILVPHDFSKAARHALKVAVELARANGGSLIVIHAIAPVYPIGEFPVTSATAWTPPAELLAASKKSLEKEIAQVVGPSGPKATVICELGDPAQRIIATVGTKKADLVVMATEGRTGLAHIVIGSVAEKVVRHSPVPVLTIRASSKRR